MAHMLAVFPLGPLGCLATQFGLAWFAASSDTGAETGVTVSGWF